MSHALHPDGIQTDISCAELVCVDDSMDNTHNCKTYIPTVMLLSCNSEQASRLHVLDVQQLMHVQIASCYISQAIYNCARSLDGTCSLDDHLKQCRK